MMKIITKIVFLFIAVFCMSTTHAIGPQALLNLAGKILSGQASQDEINLFTNKNTKISDILTGETYGVKSWAGQLQKDLLNPDIDKASLATTKILLKDALIEYSYK